MLVPVKRARDSLDTDWPLVSSIAPLAAAAGGAAYATLRGSYLASRLMGDNDGPSVTSFTYDRPAGPAAMPMRYSYASVSRLLARDARRLRYYRYGSQVASARRLYRRRILRMRRRARGYRRAGAYYSKRRKWI